MLAVAALRDTRVFISSFKGKKREKRADIVKQVAFKNPFRNWEYQKTR